MSASPFRAKAPWSCRPLLLCIAMLGYHRQRLTFLCTGFHHLSSETGLSAYLKQVTGANRMDLFSRQALLLTFLSRRSKAASLDRVEKICRRQPRDGSRFSWLTDWADRSGHVLYSRRARPRSVPRCLPCL